MKPATRVLLPLLAVALGACGSASKPPEQASAPPRTDVAKVSPQAARAAAAASAVPKTVTKAAQDAKAAATAVANGQSHIASGKNGGLAIPQTVGDGAPAKKGSPLYQRTGFGIGSTGVSLSAPSVRAGIPFSVSFLSMDGRAHKVVLETPKPRTIAVSAGNTAVVKLAGIAAGSYAVEVDGKRFKPTLSVVK